MKKCLCFVALVLSMALAGSAIESAALNDEANIHTSVRNQIFLVTHDALLKRMNIQTSTAPNVEDEVAKERQMDVYIHDGFGAAEKVDAQKEKEVKADKFLKA